MNERELQAKVMRFVREIGIAPEGKVRTVGFDLRTGVVVINTDEATYAAPAAGLWSDYADNVARIRPQHAPLVKYPDGRAGSGAHGSVSTIGNSQLATAPSGGDPLPCSSGE